MATGLEMFAALKRATGDLPQGSILYMNQFDKLDLCKLTEDDLLSVGFDEEIACRAGRDLSQQSLEELSNAMGIRLVVKEDILDLIAGEGIKRATAILRNDPQTLEEMLQEMAEIRHGGARR